jgi:C1A family cysteine protease
MSINSFPIVHGLRKDPVETKDFKLTTIKKNLPKRINWEIEMSPVKNQGSLGACVGFATVAMKEWQEQIEFVSDILSGSRLERNINYYDLSESWVYWKAKSIDPWPNEEGTSIKFAMEVLQKFGVPTEEYWQYSDKTKGDPKKNSEIVAKWYYIKSYERINNLDELKSALTKSPVVAGIGTFDEIYRPNPIDGYVEYPKREKYSLGGHAVCIVGYDDYKERIRFKNSWGVEWGHKGYGEVSYRYIKDFLWDAWLAVDLYITEKEYSI